MSNLTTNKERSDAYIELTKDILGVYVQLFPDRAWTDPASVINLMVAEIKVLREELKKERLSPR